MYVLIDNYDSFTYNLFQYLSELTAEEIRVFRNDRIDVDGIAALRPAGIIISPGPGRPEDAGVSLEAIRRFAGEIPILGVCLGHQAIGAAFGGSIIQAKAIVHGKTDAITSDGRGVFRGVPSPAVFTRYHSLVIDPETVPDGFVVTARSGDGEIMGIGMNGTSWKACSFIRNRSLPIMGGDCWRTFSTTNANRWTCRGC